MSGAEQRAFVALGANLGDPVAQIGQAFDALGRIAGTRLVRASSLYRSAPVGVPDAQPDYVNAVAELASALGPHALLAALHAIEDEAGRARAGFRAARTLDLDLLLLGDLVMDDARLSLPHPRLHERAFVLLPLVEIAPGLVIPGRGAARDFVAACAGQAISRIEAR